MTQSINSQPRFSLTLRCEINALQYDFRTGIGRAWFPPGQCCDMAGCIEAFETIDPFVIAIETFAGGDSDTMYRRLEPGSSKWEAICRR